MQAMQFDLDLEDIEDLADTLKASEQVHPMLSVVRSITCGAEWSDASV